jgi:two-component system, OmpR family, phosphate regulon sensor histidine kinase PhoR
MRLSFRARLQLALICAVALSAGAAFWAVTARIDAAATREERLRASAQNAAVAALLAERTATLAAESEAIALYPAVITAVQAGNADPLTTWAQALAQQQPTHVTVVNADGIVVARSHDPSHTGDRLADRLPGLQQALAGKRTSGAEAGDELGLALRGYAPVLQAGRVVGAVLLSDPIDPSLTARLAAGGPAPRLDTNAGQAGCPDSAGQAATCRTLLLSSAGEPSGALVVTVPLAAVRQSRSDALQRLLLVGLSLTLLGFAAAWLLGRALSRPLAALSDRAATIDGVTPTSPLPLDGPPEVRTLAAALEGLRQRVEAAAAALQRDRDVLQAVLEATEDGIVLLDSAGRQVAGNARWASLTAGQHTPEATIRQMGGSRDLTQLQREHLALGDQVAEVALDRKTPYQRLRLYSAPTPLPAADEHGRVLVLHDATQESEAERLRSALVATVSHELRSPLTVIKGYADSLLNVGPWDAATEQEFLQVIVESADRLAELVDNLLDAARLESGTLRLEREPLRLEPIARRLVEQRRTLAPLHQFALTVDEPLPLAEGDPRRIEQILANLLDNAVKYAPDGGPITVRIAAGERITVAVSDSGIGIEAEQLPKIAERFYRVENNQTRLVRGTGLGLFICRSLVEAHGGQLRVASTFGAGSTFSFDIPALTEAEPVVARPQGVA